MRLTTDDGVSIGAWHILPDAYHRSLQSSPLTSTALSQSQYDEALQRYPTIIYLHGNAANRAAPFRTASYAQFTSRLQANVIAIDYRGFGDSDGVPSEHGLTLDAKAAWDFVQLKKTADKGRDSDPPGAGVIFAAQSLGTGVGSRVARLLVEAGTPPQALVLIAPYRSLRKLFSQYRIAGLIPILAPALYIPFSNQILDRTLKTVFASDEHLPALFEHSTSQTTASKTQWPHVIISHATDDEVIPFHHGELLFDSILAAEIRRRQTAQPHDAQHQKYESSAATSDASRNLKEALLTETLLSPENLKAGNVQTKLIPGWARIEQFIISNGLAVAKDDKPPTVTLIRTENGGHNTVGEGIVDIIRDITDLGKTH